MKGMQLSRRLIRQQMRPLFGRLFRRQDPEKLRQERAKAIEERDGIYNYDMSTIEMRERELLDKYPEQASLIKKTLEEGDLLKGKKEHELSVSEISLLRAKQLRERAEKIYQEKKVERVPNIPFEKQKQIQKKLVTPMGEESENESEAEGEVPQRRSDLSSPIITSGNPDAISKQPQPQPAVEDRLKIFQYLKVIDKHASLPERAPGDNRLTVFLELDDSLLHTYIYDENFGFMADPKPRAPDYNLEYGEKGIPIRVYLRDEYQQFLNFLKNNKHIIEPIIYTSGVPTYTKMLLECIDPKAEVFEHRLYQNACYIFEKRDEDIFYMVKDITRFKAVRDMRRSVLLDPNPINFMLAPENGLPLVGYTAELHTADAEKDEYLLGITEQLLELANQADVRPFLQERYGVRQILKNAKLI